jgi:hypothetical protein
MPYIDPITGAYVENGLDALPPGYNQPKAGNEANVAQMRAQLNSEEALRQQQAAEQVKSKYLSDPTGLARFAMERMPGAGFVQGVMPSIFSPFQIAGSAVYGAGNQIANPKTANFNADTAKAMRAMQYTPPTQVGRDVSEGIAKVGEAVGPLPELWNARPSFTPDDLRVVGKTAIEDVRNFPQDYTNAQQGLTRDYPTLGSRTAGLTRTAGDVARPIAEKAYDMYMNPESGVEVYGLKPSATLDGLFAANKPMYAVKPGGGNNPTNMGSTLPLKEQGKIGTHLSEVQIADPYEKWLDLIKNRGGDAKHYFDKFVSEKKSSGELGDEAHYSPEAWKEKLQEIAEEYTHDYNKIKSEEIPNYVPIFSPSQLQAIAPPFNAWTMNPYQKYITNQMGTGLASDPYLKEINEANIPLHELFNLNPGGGNFTRAEDAAKRRAQFLRYNQDNPNFDINAPQNANIGKQTATTEFGKQLEDYLDNTLYPSHASFYRPEKFPQVSKMPRETVVNDFLSSEPWKQTGFHAIQDRMMRDLVENKLDINKISNRTPALIVRDMIKEYKEKQNSKAVVQKKKDDWRAARFDSLQSDVPYEDGSKMHVITPEDVKADENLAMRDLGLSTIDLNQCVGAGCRNTAEYPNVHGPYIEPHTGQVTKGAYPYEDTHIKRYIDRLKNGKLEIARLIDPKGIAKATVALDYETPQVLRVSQQKEVADKWLENHDPQALIEFEQNVANFGTPEALKNAYQLYPELYAYVDKLNTKPTKYISEMKGKDNREIEAKYVPHMVEWLNQHADELTSVRDLGNLKGVHDLDNHYDSIGKMTDEHSHWYSPTVEEFFKKADDGRLLPRFFTTDQFAQLATDMGVDLSAEPPKQLSNWDKQTLREEVYSVLIKDPESLYLQDNLKDDYVQNLDILFGDRNPEGQVPIDIHRKLADILLDHNGKYTDIANSTLAQLADRGPNGWVQQFTEPQITNMLDIMAGWFQKHPFEKLPSNADLERAVQEHPDPFNEIQISESPWHPSENDLVNAVREMEPENAGEFDRPSPQRITSLQQAMDRFFNNQPINITVDEAGDYRILMGNPRPEAQLPRDIHESLVESFLDQDSERHLSNIRYIIDTLQGPGYFASMPELTTPQLENILNMAISWTERYPLNE